MEFRIADTADDLVQAYRILHDVYVEAGMIAVEPLEMRLRPQDLLPTTWTIIARHRGCIVGEVTLVGDSALGLPMEATHAAEIGALRQRGVAMVECSGLMCVPAYRDSGLSFVLFGQVRALLRRLGIATMVMRVSPRLAPLYRDVLGCDALGETRCDPSLLGNWYTAISLDVEGCEPRVRSALTAGAAGG
ncbi:MAG: hypothetical protein H7138_12190, partial [Myxococcales bacterium]|nr:hypothetical protein [Myxococcales bacterium]